MGKEDRPHLNSNWVQRYIIQQSINKNSTQTDPSENDPLKSIKQDYYQMFMKTIGLKTDSPDIPAGLSVVEKSISQLVDYTATTAIGFYSGMIANIPQNANQVSRSEDIQYLNEIMSEVGRGSERIIELTVELMATYDPLAKHKIGKFIRRIIPTAEQMAVKKASRSTRKKVDEVSKEFIDKMRRKYR